MSPADVVVCSFHTDDEYYARCAERLRANLADLGLRSHIDSITAAPGEDWSDICRRKIGFLDRVCAAYPDAKVFWTDVDCQLLDFPDYIANFTADLIGFQRGFGSPLGIGYANRTRFWEPCFFGINTSASARTLVSDAARIEASLRIKATDDYFLEESWRANAAALSFQVIPSAAVVGRSADAAVPAFFVFGSSGNVSGFRGKVTQHRSAVRRPYGKVRVRAEALRAAKGVEAVVSKASQPTAARMRRWADARGITHLLTQDGRTGGVNRHRAQLINQMIVAGQAGDVTAVRSLSARVTQSGIPSAKEVGAIQAAESFAAYATQGEGDPLPLMWWARPFPGNFGDWLSPFVMQRVTGRPIRYLAPTAPRAAAHLVAVGSIGRFVKPASTVVGTGISSPDLALDPRARYISVRGPLTADVVRTSGGPDVTSWGDPALLLQRHIPLDRGPSNGRLALVRHFAHANLPVTLPEDTDELSVLASHPDDLISFLQTLTRYDGVITSAMHVMIACHSYGIPCALIGFDGFADTVHGTGMKYRDYSLGAGLDTVWEPQFVPLRLAGIDWGARLRTEKIGEDKLDEIEAALTTAVAESLDRTG